MRSERLDGGLEEGSYAFCFSFGREKMVWMDK